MASEGEFPKIDGDVLYASETNQFLYSSLSTTDKISFTSTDYNYVLSGLFRTIGSDDYTSIDTSPNITAYSTKACTAHFVSPGDSTDISGLTATKGGTWDSDPTDLANATDGDFETYTTNGDTSQTAINLSYIQLDLGELKTDKFFKVKYKMTIDAGTFIFLVKSPKLTFRYLRVSFWDDGTYCRTALQYSTDGSSWTTYYESQRVGSSATNCQVGDFAIYESGDSDTLIFNDDETQYTNVDASSTDFYVLVKGSSEAGTLKIGYLD